MQNWAKHNHENRVLRPQIGGNVTLVQNFTLGMTPPHNGDVLGTEGGVLTPLWTRVTLPNTLKSGIPIPHFEVAESEYHGGFRQFCGIFEKMTPFTLKNAPSRNLQNSLRYVTQSTRCSVDSASHRYGRYGVPYGTGNCT